MRIICKTTYPEISVAGLGNFKNGDILEVIDANRIIAGHLLQTPEWDFVPEDEKPRTKKQRMEE